MSETDIRWKQRFDNLEKAFRNLSNAVTKKELSDLESAGLIKTYEFTFELSWKTIGDYLNEKKVEVKFPRDIVKEAFKFGILSDGDVWIDMLDKRNLMSHTYDKEDAKEACDLIKKKYFEEFEKLIIYFKKEL